MNEEKLIKLMQKCIYRRYYHDVVSVATLKHLINIVAKKHIYCKAETRKSRIKGDKQ
tara:strand:- start:910 stop:1080 length:171 start_codon:yes stop_codon:yes gene_type:complete